MAQAKKNTTTRTYNMDVSLFADEVDGKTTRYGTSRMKVHIDFDVPSEKLEDMAARSGIIKLQGQIRKDAAKVFDRDYKKFREKYNGTETTVKLSELLASRRVKLSDFDKLARVLKAKQGNFTPEEAEELHKLIG